MFLTVKSGHDIIIDVVSETAAVLKNKFQETA